MSFDKKELAAAQRAAAISSLWERVHKRLDTLEAKQKEQDGIIYDLQRILGVPRDGDPTGAHMRGLPRDDRPHA